jgi:hypothetical protein
LAHGIFQWPSRSGREEPGGMILPSLASLTPSLQPASSNTWLVCRQPLVRTALGRLGSRRRQGSGPEIASRVARTHAMRCSEQCTPARPPMDGCFWSSSLPRLRTSPLWHGMRSWDLDFMGLVFCYLCCCLQPPLPVLTLTFRSPSGFRFQKRGAGGHGFACVAHTESWWCLRILLATSEKTFGSGTSLQLRD